MNPLKAFKLYLQFNRLKTAFEKADWSSLKMHGWKTWVAAGIVAGSAALEYLGYSEIARALLTIGGSLGLIGLGHKIEKTINKE